MSAGSLQLVLRQGGVGTWQVDMLTGLATWDAVSSEILGVPSSPMAMGEPLPIHPEDEAMLRERLQHRAADGCTGDMEFRILRPDGEVRWLRATGCRTDAPEAMGCYVGGIVTDITEHHRAIESLRKAEERYRLVSQVTADVIFDWDIVNDRLNWNEATRLFFGYTSEELGSMSALRPKIHPDEQERVVEELREIFESDQAKYTSEHRFLGSDGNYSHVHSSGCVIRDASGHPTRMVGMVQDVTEQRYADAALLESEAINRGIVEASADRIVLMDLEGRLLFLNKESVLKDTSAQYGQHWASFWPASQINDAIITAAAGEVARFSESFTFEGQLRWWDVVVSPIRDDSGKPIKLVAIARDITHRREADEQLRRAAAYDSLTNLPNRACFQERLKEAVVRVCTVGGRVGLLLLDVDDFKQVNDSLGHDAGDALLRCFASRLEVPATRNGLVARLGGDEFGVLIEDIADEAELRAHAAAMLQRMKEPLIHDGRMLDCHATIGAAFCPDHGTTPDELLKNADIALYVAKGSSRGGIATFEPSHRDGLQQWAAMVSLARTALQEDRVEPFYQPKVALSDHRLDGFEALLRWRHPVRGMQLPATISPAFEDLEVATAISERMIERVIGDMRNWLDLGLTFGHVAVNAAAAEFRSDAFAEGVLERLHSAGVPTRCFQLEVTETVFLGRGAEYVDRALKLLSREGVRIALDDFGTGYASLRHLKQFPVHVIKIDQGFVQGMRNNPEDAAIISAVLNLGKGLDIDVVAEGIETIEQDVHLRQLGCEFGQGFLYSEAVSSGSVPGLLRRFSPRRQFAVNRTNQKRRVA